MNILKRLFETLLFVTLAGSVPVVAQQSALDGDTASFVAFENELDQIRQALHIPGMAAAIVQDQELVWAKGFGYADVEEEIPVTAETPFHLASVTKPIAATLMMQLVEEGVLELNEPAADYGVNFQNPDITVWHLLTHTSEGVPGTAHNYNGNRYVQRWLDAVRVGPHDESTG